MGMRALAIDAEPIQRRGMRRGEIAVGAAAGRRIDQVETDSTAIFPAYRRVAARRCRFRKAGGSTRR